MVHISGLCQILFDYLFKACHVELPITVSNNIIHLLVTVCFVHAQVCISFVFHEMLLFVC